VQRSRAGSCQGRARAGASVYPERCFRDEKRHHSSNNQHSSRVMTNVGENPFTPKHTAFWAPPPPPTWQLSWASSQSTPQRLKGLRAYHISVTLAERHAWEGYRHTHTYCTLITPQLRELLASPVLGHFFKNWVGFFRAEF
jgi:hypothetical protein